MSEKYFENESYNYDAYKQYTNSISKYKLLTKEEEIELAKKIKKGDKYAREQFINSNLKLVVSLANKYSYFDVDIMDIIQYGNIGLMKAVDKFDYKRGNKFSTYAVKCIKTHILDGCYHESKLITLPEDLYTERKKINEAKNELFSKLGCEPTIQEIADYLGLSKKKLQLILTYFNSIESLDANVEDEDGEICSLYDLIPDDHKIACELIEDEELINELYSTIEKLPEREKFIIINSFGLEDNKYTIDKMSKILGVSKETVRLSKKKAIKSIRDSLLKKGYDEEDINLAG